MFEGSEVLFVRNGIKPHKVTLKVKPESDFEGYIFQGKERGMRHTEWIVRLVRDHRKAVNVM